MLFSHFHDILPGSGVAATRHFFQGQLQRVQAVAGQARQQALRALAARVDTTGVGPVPPGAADAGIGFGAGVGRATGELSFAAWVGEGPRPFVVVNPTAWSRREVAMVTVWDGDGSDGVRPGDRPWTVVGADGVVHAAQRVGSGHYWGHEYVELAVLVTVPAGGWTVLGVRAGEAPAPAVGASLEFEQDGGHGQRSNQACGRLAISNERLTYWCISATNSLPECLCSNRSSIWSSIYFYTNFVLEYITSENQGTISTDSSFFQ